MDSHSKKIGLEEFEAFWNLYPRRVAKKDAMKAWSNLSAESRKLAIKTIKSHVALWEAEGREVQFRPYAASWLRGERFHDEIDMPEPKATHAWWTSDEGVMKKAREIDIHPKPGEDMATFRQRVIQMSRAA